MSHAHCTERGGMEVETGIRSSFNNTVYKYSINEYQCTDKGMMRSSEIRSEYRSLIVAVAEKNVS